MFKEIRQQYKGHSARYRKPEERVIREVERRRRRRLQDPEYREHIKQQTRANYARGRSRANSAVANALKREELVRPSECESCGRNGIFIEAAHADYSRPLDVTWLCRQCHRRWDYDEPKTKPADHERIYPLPDPALHDYRRYNRGCRCNVCRASIAAYRRDARARQKAHIT